MPLMISGITPDEPAPEKKKKPVRKRECIGKFSGEYAFLSNMFPAEFVFNNVKWHCSEHMYQAAKACTKEDILAIIAAKDGYEAKKIAKAINPRHDWEATKVAIMRIAVREKFRQNQDLFDKLAHTAGIDLVEGNNWHDNFWGDCTCVSCRVTGENMLGIILMELRDQIVEERVLLSRQRFIDEKSRSK